MHRKMVRNTFKREECTDCSIRRKRRRAPRTHPLCVLLLHREEIFLFLREKVFIPGEGHTKAFLPIFVSSKTLYPFGCTCFSCPFVLFSGNFAGQGNNTK